MTVMSRRSLFAHAARIAAGVTVFAAAPACAFNPLPALPTRSMPPAEARIAWLRLLPDGRVQLLLPRQEMGQGVSVALRQIVAEELGWELERVEAVLPDTAAIAPVKSTVGSDSLKDFAEPAARAAALLREHLRSGSTASEIRDQGQPVVLRSLRGGGRFVGRSHPTERIADIVTGAPSLYAGDIRLPGMLFGLVLPVGAEPRELTAGLRLVELSDGRRGLLSDHAGPLHAVTLDRPADAHAMPEMDIDAVERRGHLEHTLRGDAVMRDTAWTLDRRYDIPFAAHAAIEPRSAVAQWHDCEAEIRLEVWTGTQDAFFVRETLARQFGLSAEAVLVHSCRIGGGFGARTIVRQELEAALLAQAAGRPVKVQWSRAAEFADGFHRPPSSHRIRARLDAQGRITDWWHGFCSGHVIFTSAAMPRWMQFVTGFVKDPGVARGALPPYAAGRMRVEFSDLRLPVDTGPWRGLGAGPNGYAIESAVDELAQLAGQDPLRFRLANLDPQHGRLKACLEAVRDLSGWGAPVPASMGRGIACGIYKESSYAAVVAAVEMAADGAARVTHLWCAQDSGLVINPDQLRAQIEGNLLWGLGMVLTEKLLIEGGRVAAYTFADYPIPTMDVMPAIDIALLEPPGAAPSGAGETAIVAVAAITNAIAAATGRRVLASLSGAIVRMSDYASAAFVGLILRQMAAAGIAPPSDLQVGSAPGGPPQVTLDLKRRLLAHACGIAGPAFVIEVGQGIHAVPNDPTLDVLRRAADPAGLLDRWARLEKYHHSHHRVDVLRIGEGAAQLRHRSLRGPAPAALESLAVFGLLVALLQSIGCDGIEADLGDQPAMRQGRAVLTALPSGPGDWHLRWSAVRREKRILPLPQPGLVEQLYALLDDDPVRPWPISVAADALGLSSRDLQRRLHRQGASWSGILRDARVRRAAKAMLDGAMLDTPASLAEIGYAAGFADQAHFTREFRRILGASPAEWRRVAAARPA